MKMNVRSDGGVTKIVAGVRSIAVGAIVACACLAGGAEPVRNLPFPLPSVRLTGGPLHAQQEQNRRYLLRLEPDRLLSRFRSEAGLKPKAEPYGGWENPALKRDRWIALPGHILAFWMSGAAMTVEATGDEELKRRLLYVVDELEAVQNAHGCGYALATKNGRRAYAEIARGDIRLPDRVVNGRRGFIFREMPIPQELVAGKKEIEVRFEPKPGNIAGGLFGLWLVPSSPARRRRRPS